MKIQIITLFPDMFSGVFAESMLHKAQQQKLAQIKTIDLRGFGIGPRKKVDDTPYGGGDGMLLRPEPIADAITHAKSSNAGAKVILLTPSGQTLKQSVAQSLSAESGLILICGRYEGVDERIVDIVDMELSIGNYVLTGGEIPAMVVVDSVVRLIPGVLGGETSAEIESFSDGKSLEYPQYTKPEEWNSIKVPSVLLSGNHQKIAEWRLKQSIKKTKLRDEQNK